MACSSRHQRALTHEENRLKVCVVCMQKGDYKITDIVLQRIRQIFIENYDASEQCSPGAICGRCRALLIDIDNGKKNTNALPEVYDFSEIQPFLRSSTRCTPNPLCHCKICLIATTKSVPSRQKGRPRNEENRESLSSPRYKGVMKVCMNCKSPVRRGLPHKCTLTTLRGNLISTCSEIDNHSKEIVASKILKERNEGHSCVCPSEQDGQTICVSASIRRTLRLLLPSPPKI